MTRDQLFSHLETRITGHHVAYSGLAAIDDLLGVLLELVSQCPDCKDDIKIIEDDPLTDEEEELAEVFEVTIQKILEDGIVMIGNIFIAHGTSVDDYFALLVHERDRQSVLWSQEADAKLTPEDWYYILCNQHGKAVDARLSMATDRSYTGEHPATRLAKLAATFLAATENLYPAEKIAEPV